MGTSSWLPGPCAILVLASVAFLGACTPFPPDVPSPLPAQQPTAPPVSQRLAIDAIRASTSYMDPTVSQEAAFDSDLTTGWAPNEGAGASIEATFPTTVTVTGLRLHFIAPSGSRMEAVRLTFSDGGTQLVTVGDRDGWQEVAVRPVVTRSVRLTVLSLTTSARERGLPVYVPELEVYGFARSSFTPPQSERPFPGSL